MRIVQANPEAKCFWNDINHYGFIIEDEKITSMVLRHERYPYLQCWDFSQADQGNWLIWSE